MNHIKSQTQDKTQGQTTGYNHSKPRTQDQTTGYNHSKLRTQDKTQDQTTSYNHSKLRTQDLTTSYNHTKPQTQSQTQDLKTGYTSPSSSFTTGNPNPTSSDLPLQNYISQTISIFNPNPFLSFTYDEQHIWIGIKESTLKSLCNLVESKIPSELSLWYFIEKNCVLELGVNLLLLRKKNGIKNRKMNGEKNRKMNGVVYIYMQRKLLPIFFCLYQRAVSRF